MSNENRSDTVIPDKVITAITNSFNDIAAAIQPYLIPRLQMKNASRCQK